MGIPFSKKKIALALTLAGIGSLAVVLSGAMVANADPYSPACYRMKGSNNPFGAQSSTQSTIWCYKNLEQPAGARVIYGIDDKGRTSPELTMMVEANGTLVHASLKNGKRTVHRLSAIDFNPLGAPLEPPSDAERIAPPIAPSSVDSPEEGIRIFQDYGDIMVHAAKVQPGQVSVSVPPESMPWRGYWYPYSSGRLHNGNDSPLAKYDRFIARRAAGAHLGSQTWEKKNHGRGLAWSGHCNGWAAASVLAPEPKTPIVDPFTGITFTPSNQKALLMVRHYCPKIVFYGARNYGKPGDDPADIYPNTFHNVLSYFLGELKKPVLMDDMPTVPVENTVVSGYTMRTTQVGANTYYVETTVRIHMYDKDISEQPGVAGSINRTYRYTLTTDNSGYVTGGSWNSPNPDFLWIALAPGDCEDRNKTVDPFWVDEIFRFKKEEAPAPAPAPNPDPLPAPPPSVPAPASVDEAAPQV